MKAAYRLQRDQSLVDYIIDFRPIEIRDQKLPQIEVSASINSLEPLFDLLKEK